MDPRFDQPARKHLIERDHVTVGGRVFQPFDQSVAIPVLRPVGIGLLIVEVRRVEIGVRHRQPIIQTLGKIFHAVGIHGSVVERDVGERFSVLLPLFFGGRRIRRAAGGKRQTSRRKRKNRHANPKLFSLHNLRPVF